MNILLIGDNNSPHFVKWVAAHVDRYPESKIFVADYRNAKDLEAVVNIRIHPTGVKVFDIILLIFAIRRYSHEFDIIHAYYVTTYALIPKFLNAKVKLISVWGSDILIFPEKSFVHQLYTRWLLKNATMVFATSSTLLGRTQKYFSGTIKCIPYGVEFKSDNIKVVSDVVYIGFVKKLDYVYNQFTALKAFDLMVNNNRGLFEFHIYGDGPLKDRILSYASTLSSFTRIKYHGYIMNNKVALAYNKLDIVVNISHSESFGVSVLEAISYGCAVIVSNIPAFKELLELSGEEYYCVDPKDSNSIVNAYKALSYNPELRRSQNSHLKSIVSKKYNWIENKTQFFKIQELLYEEIGHIS